MRFLPFLFILFSASLFAQIDTNKSDEMIIYPLEQLNSEFRETNLSITPNGKQLYFMSGRGEAPWSSHGHVVFDGKQEYDGDIWFSRKQDTTWQKPKFLPKIVNTRRGEDEPNISPGGQTVYFQSWKMGWERSGGPYYRAELYGEDWENPVGLFGGINQFFRDSIFKYQQYATDGMAISPDQRIFLVAAGPYYDRQMDLYISRREPRGKWSYPERLAISTDDNERSVFIAADNQTVYFGSDGYGGEGGIEILKTTLRVDNSCDTIINIGAPFNTKEDDYGFIIGALGNDAYFVRNSDIYYAHLGENNDFIKPQPTVLIEGTVVDCDGNPSQAQVELYDLATNELLMTARSNSTTGEYAFSMLQRAGKFLQRFKYADDTITVRENFELTMESEATLVFDIRPECAPLETPISPPEPEPLALLPAPEPIDVMVYFDFDKSNIKISEQSKLDALLQQLKERSATRIQVIGHTDSKGSDAYNIALSERRAKQVAAYLEAQNSDIQLDFKGETVPTASNDSSENRAKNRRVRVIVE